MHGIGLRNPSGRVTPVLVQNVFPEKLTAWRHVVYTCFQPRSMASPGDLQVLLPAEQNA